MPLQLVLTLIAASLGFVSAIFFSIGTILNTPESTLLQSTPFFDFNEPIAQSLSAQRAQYLVGAILLVTSFAIQVLAIVVSPKRKTSLPQNLCHWYLVIFIVLLSSAVCFPISQVIEDATIKQVQALRAHGR